MKFAILAAFLLTTPLTKPTEPSYILIEEVHVGTVGEGIPIVMLISKQPSVRYMPIQIGITEAINIQLRMQRYQPPRPLTLNLLENVMKSADIKIEKIVVDTMANKIYTGFLVLRQGERVWKVDARPSDAIGLAIGANVPVYVEKDLFERASISAEELKKEENKEQKKKHKESI